MDNNQLNEDMKRLFNNFHPELDTDEIWENIEPFLDKKKKRRPFFLLWWGLGILGVILTYSFFFSNINQQLNVHQDTSIRKSGTSLPPTASTNDKLEATADPTPDQAALTPILPQPSRSETNKHNNTHTINPFDIILPNKRNDINSSAETTGRDITAKSSGAIMDNSFSFERLERIPTIDLIPYRAEKTAGRSIEEEEEIVELDLPKKIKPKKKKSWRNNLQLYVAPQFAVQQISSKNYPENQFADKRLATENPGFSYRLGANYQLIQRNGIVFSTGINYEQINDRFKWSKTDREVETITGTVAVVVNAIGDTIRRKYGPKIRETVITQTRIAANRYRFVNIPIGIGFEKRNRKSIQKFTGGVNLNLSFSMKGYQLTLAGEPVKMDPGVINGYYQTVYRKKAKLGLWASYEYSREINAHLSWMVAPEIHIPIYSLTTEVYPLKQKYYSLQIRVGINCLIAPTKNMKK